MIDAFLQGAILSIEGLALAIAAGLLVILRLWLPPGSREPLRLPFGLLVLHLLLLGLGALLAPSGGGGSFLEAAAVFTVLASIGRSTFLLVMDCLFGPKVVRPLPKILREILQGFIYVAVLFITLRAGGVDPTSLLTTSALHRDHRPLAAGHPRQPLRRPGDPGRAPLRGRRLDPVRP